MRNAAIMVVVDQRPPGAWACNRWPPRTRPHKRVMFVFAPLSSMNTKRLSGMSRARRRHQPRRARMSGRFCSLARSVFFTAIAQTLERVVNCDPAAANPAGFAQLLQGGIGMGAQGPLQALQGWPSNGRHTTPSSLACAKISRPTPLLPDLDHEPVADLEAFRNGLLRLGPLFTRPYDALA